MRTCNEFDNCKQWAFPLFYRTLEPAPLPARAFFSASTSQQQHKTAKSSHTAALSERENESRRAISRCIRRPWELNLQSGIRSTDTLTGCRRRIGSVLLIPQCDWCPAVAQIRPNPPESHLNILRLLRASVAWGLLRRPASQQCVLQLCHVRGTHSGAKTALPTTNPHWKRVFVCVHVCVCNVGLVNIKGPRRLRGLTLSTRLSRQTGEEK